ncbi:redoxin domain-containing protein [Candidatus Poribacteria bacterium]|nr:redoxin domain-containing protein [Candidatus Poribacteria bacterium]
MQDNYDKFKAAGAELIAISSDSVGDTKQTIDKEGLKFVVLADNDREVINAYNVVDPGNNRIARPASYIIKQDGTIAWKFLDVRLGNRVPTAEILEELGKL